MIETVVVDVVPVTGLLVSPPTRFYEEATETTVTGACTWGPGCVATGSSRDR